MQFYGAHGDLHALPLRKLLLRHKEFVGVFRAEMKNRMALAGVKGKRT